MAIYLHYRSHEIFLWPNFDSKKWTTKSQLLPDFHMATTILKVQSTTGLWLNGKFMLMIEILDVARRGKYIVQRLWIKLNCDNRLWLLHRWCMWVSTVGSDDMYKSQWWIIIWMYTSNRLKLCEIQHYLSWSCITIGSIINIA